ncbi:hypothetical protein K449DRAFT_183948 [Hypoxylon sp. EC38]|nr:hypothetical protein K449DRAFT_183948 [Hypoxylon sp. EC38]
MSNFKYPSIADMMYTSYSKEQATSSSSGPAISTGAIAGIAVGGAVVLFAALAILLMKLAKRQDRRRASSVSPSEFPEIAAETGAGGPKRLRKRSIVSEQHVAITVDKEDDETGMEESRSRRSSLQVSPARTRPGSFSMGNGSGGGSGSRNGSARNSVDTQMGVQVHKTRSPEKQRGYGMYQHRRKTSWIDEDALHGPTITCPQKTKQKHRRRVSWFDGGLARSLSRLSTRSGISEVSPTLPYTEGRVVQELDARVESPGTRDGSKNGHSNGYNTGPRSSQQQQQVKTSPQRTYGPTSISNPNLLPSNIAQSPPDIVHNPRYRDRVSLQAAQRLAGGARLPAPINIPTQGQGQPQRQPILKHSATDTELTEILRMTAERLRDGNRSERRKTLMMPYAPRRLANGGIQVIRTDFKYEPSDRGEISPAKSHKSAPATMSYAELEGSTPKIQSPQKQIQTPRHSRQQSHISRMSQGSILSEPDSLVAPKRESLSGVQTALSSPSRHARSTGPTPSPQGSIQQARPFSYGSSMSSALSTLYSMEEASIRSQPVGDLVFDSSPIEKTKRTPEKVLSAFGPLNLNANRQSDLDGRISPKHQLEDDDIPAPLRIRRGTLGGTVPPDNTPASLPPSHKKTRSRSPLKRISSFAAHAKNGNDDPFTAVAMPRNPARLSKVFSPLPADPASGKAARKQEKQESHYENTPTPSPIRRTAMPSPRSIINSPSYKRSPSPAISEAGLSSVYDSYTYNHSEPQRDSSGDSTATIIPPPKIIGSEISPAKVASSIPASFRESRVSFRVPNYGSGNRSSVESILSQHESLTRPQPQPQPPGSPLRPRRSMPSAESMSIYSQDEDSVPPLRASSTLRGKKSVRMSHTISELRRMNSQISTMSDQSVASTTLPFMRGGGSSPGKQGGGGKNYLALGGSLRDGLPGPPSGIGHRRNSSAQRARRGTVVLQGLDVKRGSVGRTNSVRHSGQLVTQAAKLKRQETAIKRTSVESLYDAEGFLKG